MLNSQCSVILDWLLEHKINEKNNKNQRVKINMVDTHYFLRHHHKDIEVLTVRSNSLCKNPTKHPNVRKLSFVLSSQPKSDS